MKMLLCLVATIATLGLTACASAPIADARAAARASGEVCRPVIARNRLDKVCGTPEQWAKLADAGITCRKMHRRDTLCMDAAGWQDDARRRSYLASRQGSSWPESPGSSNENHTGDWLAAGNPTLSR